MARRVFFSFHYQRDLWRANIVRNSAVVEGVAAAGFSDASLWEKTKREGDTAIQRLIDSGLSGTSVTVVLIGAQTASRHWVTYEIQKSIERGNGLLGVRIHTIKDKDGQTDTAGLIPTALERARARICLYEYGRLGDWVEQAYRDAHPGS